ncbi:hypothetical protein ACJZ2D_005351 [Fusarium nematophilum]
MLVAAPLPAQRVAKMKRNTLAYLGYRMLVESEKTLDLLQGLLVVLAWAHVCFIDDGQVTSLEYLALGYAHRLGITQIPPSLLEQIASTNQPETSGFAAKTRVPQTTHSLDEQRALLGLYCILSVTSTKQSRRNPLDGPYIDICCKTVAAAQSTKLDLILDRFVRLMQMNEQLSRGFGEPHERTLSRPYAFLLEGNGRRFRTELDRIAEAAAHPDVADRRQVFNLYHHYLIARLYEPAVVVADHPGEGVSPSMYRSLCLRNALAAVQSFFDLVLSSPGEGFLRRSIITVDQAAFVMVLSARLLLIDAPDWDVQLARQTLDLSTILDRILERMDEMQALRVRAIETFACEAGDDGLLGESGGGNVAELAQKTRWLKGWFEARLQGRRGEEIAPMANEVAGMGRGTGDDVAGGGTTWFGGLLGNMAWNFDSFE